MVNYSTIFKFADDLKCFKTICSITDSTQFQSDLSSLYGWSLDNRLFFSIKKCVVLHFKANSTVTSNYFINGTELTNVTKHRDLGVFFLVTCSGPIILSH